MSADIPNAPGHEVSSTVNASDGNVAAGGDIHSHDIDLAQLDGGDNTEVTMDSLVARIQYFEKKIAKVESEKDSYKRKAERREERIAVLKSEVSEPCQDCEELPQVQKQLAKLTEEYDQLQKQTERYYKDAARYYQQCKTLSASKNKLEQDITKLQNGSVGRNRQTEEHVKSLERRIADQEKLLKKAQEDVFNAKDTTDSMVEPDSSINALIKSLERDVKTFAKQHAIKGTGDADLQQFFGADHQIIREMIDEEGMKALGHARVEKNAPSILLSAWLVHEAYRSIAAKPWYFMDEMESRLWKGEEVHIDTGFSRFFSMLHHCYGQNNKSINTILSEAFRILSPAIASAEPSPLQGDDGLIQSAINAAKDVMCAHFAKKFMMDARPLLATPPDEAMYQQLYSIMRSAAEVSEKLYVQRCTIAIKGYSKLPEVFDSRSVSMEAHSNHMIELEDDESCLDGKRVLMVAHPEVVAIGSSDGSDLTTVRVLRKAVVWMGKD